MSITEIVYIMYATNHGGWGLSQTFSLRSPLAVSRNWRTLQENHYELLEHIIGHSLEIDKSAY